MIRQNVNSSDIASIGYDIETMVLEIEFKSGSIYQYFNVPENIYNTLMSASSYGKYFNQNIRDVYQYSKIN